MAPRSANVASTTEATQERIAELMARYATACEFPRPLNADRVGAALCQFYAALKEPEPRVTCVRSFEAARAAWAAWDARAAWAAWDARAARAAWDAMAARAAWAAWDAWAARAAWDARAAWAAWDAWAARAAWDARAARAARDASWEVPTAFGAIANGAVEVELTWLPLLDALEAGCWLFWPLDGEVLWMPQPRVLTDEARALHCEDGPAFAIEDGERMWFWHGVFVPQDVVEQPEQITAGRILAEQNAEVRRVMLERMGIGPFVRDANPKVLHEDVDGAAQPRRLLRVKVPWVRGGAMVICQVQCPSTGHEYLLPVPPRTKRCDEAIAWTYGLSAAQYAPLVEA